LSLKHCGQGQRGASAVEFALVLPLLVTFLVGVVDLSLALYNKWVLTQASWDAVRAGIVLRSPKLTAAEIAAVAVERSSPLLVTLGGSSTPTVAVTPTTGGGAFGTPLSVTVTFAYKGLLLGSLISPSTGTLTLSGSTSMNNE